MFRKVLFMWSSMPIFSFIGYTLTELFRKPDNWGQIYKQPSSNYHTSNDVSRRKNYWYLIARLQSSCLITCWSLFLTKLQTFSLQVFWKETPAQVLSCEVRETFKMTSILKNICKRLLLEVSYKKLFLKTLQYLQGESS